MQSSISTDKFIFRDRHFRVGETRNHGEYEQNATKTHFRKSVLKTLLSKVPAMTSSSESPFVGFGGGDGSGRHLVRKHE